MNRIKIYADDNVKNIKDKLVECLNNNNIQIDDVNFNLAVAIGGDGSFLKMVRDNNFDSNICYVGINTGTLGFLQEIDKNKIEEFVKIISESFNVQNISISSIYVYTNEKEYKFESLNEVIIRDKMLKVCRLDVLINNELLEHYGGEGILVATSTGSTAENLSHGGSIVYNGINSLQITPVGPTVNSMYKNLLNSVVVPEDNIISLIPIYNTKNLLISIDGNSYIFDNVNKIDICISNNTIKCLRTDNYNFTNIINSKFLK